MYLAWPAARDLNGLHTMTGGGSISKSDLAAAGAFAALLFPVLPESIHWGAGKRVFSKSLSAAD